MNHIIQEQIVAMLKHSELSDGFWAEALLMAMHIINMSPSKALGCKILQEMLSGNTPYYSKLRIFGCEAYALVPKDERRKLDSWSWECILLAYGPDRIFGYPLWDQEN